MSSVSRLYLIGRRDQLLAMVKSLGSHEAAVSAWQGAHIYSADASRVQAARSDLQRRWVNSSPVPALSEAIL